MSTSSTPHLLLHGLALRLGQDCPRVGLKARVQWIVNQHHPVRAESLVLSLEPDGQRSRLVVTIDTVPTEQGIRLVFGARLENGGYGSAQRFLFHEDRTSYLVTEGSVGNMGAHGRGLDVGIEYVQANALRFPPADAPLDDMAGLVAYIVERLIEVEFVPLPRSA